MNHNLRIIISLTIAFLVVNLYGRISSSPFITQIQAENIKGILSNIKFPTISLNKIFTLKINPQIDNHPVSNNQNSFNLTPILTKPTNLSYVQPSTVPTINLNTTYNPGSGPFNIPTPTYIAPKIPTYTPKPTKKPKATATPKPKPITTDERPGNTLYEIFDEVSRRACFPLALLKAIQYKESGSYFKPSDSASKIKTYNTYGWWINGTGDPCIGLGYSFQTGIVPPDSVNPGYKCKSAIGDPNDLKIMGITSISEWEQSIAQKYITGIIPKNDRRVLFDNALMFAYISRSRVGNPPANCNDWPDEAVRTVAEKHSGTCFYAYTGTNISGDYCKEILDLYKKYKKEE